MWLVLVLVILVAVGLVPTWGFHTYGWGPSGIVGLMLVVLVVLILVRGL